MGALAASAEKWSLERTTARHGAPAGTRSRAQSRGHVRKLWKSELRLDDEGGMASLQPGRAEL